MNRIFLSTLAGLVISTTIAFAELEDIALQFVTAATSGDAESLRKACLECPTRAKMVTEFAQILPQIQAKKLRISRIENELVIGDLGVTLIRLDLDGHAKPNYKPLICVRTDSGWRVFPWASQADLNILLEQRSPEEQIHLKLFNEWGNLIEELLTKQAEQDGADRPATAPKSKAE